MTIIETNTIGEREREGDRNTLVKRNKKKEKLKVLVSLSVGDEG